MQAAQVVVVVDGRDGFPQAFGHLIETYLQSLEYAFLKAFLEPCLDARLDARLDAFLAELFGECHSGALQFGLAHGTDLTIEGVFVNISEEDVSNEEFEGSPGQLKHQSFIPHWVSQEAGDALCLHHSQGHDPRRGPTDGLERQGGTSQRRKAAALAGSEKPALKSLSCG